MNGKISELPQPLRLGLLAALAALSVVSLEMGGAARNAWRDFPPPLDRPLPPALTRFSLACALGDEARLASDWGYIECLQYMGGANAPDGFFKQTMPMYREVQWLDPGFRFAIREGISAVGWLYRRPEEAEELARIALATDHHETHYGAYIAALAYQKHLDPAGVLGALEPEAQRPDAPEMLLRVVGNLILRQGDWRRSLNYWRWVQSRAQDQDTLDMAARTLLRIHEHLDAHPSSTPPRP